MHGEEGVYRRDLALVSMRLVSERRIRGQLVYELTARGEAEARRLLAERRMRTWS
jgi:hypothetical protein